MHIEHDFAEIARGIDGIAAHPEDVAGIEIGGHIGAGRGVQAMHGFRVVDQLATVVFERDPFRPTGGHRLAPILFI